MEIVYLVYRESGEFDSFDVQVVKAFTAEADAKEFVDLANKQVVELVKRTKGLLLDPKWNAPHIDAKIIHDPVRLHSYQEQVMAVNKRWDDLRHSILSIDEDGDEDCTYGYSPLELHDSL